MAMLKIATKYRNKIYKKKKNSKRNIAKKSETQDWKPLSAEMIGSFYICIVMLHDSVYTDVEN